MRRTNISLSVMLGLLGGAPACDEPIDRSARAVEPEVLEREVEDITVELQETDLCTPDGMVLDEVLDGEDADVEHRLAVRLVEEHLGSIDVELVCQAPREQPDALVADDEISRSCNFVNTGICTSCLSGWKMCTFCYEGDWWCSGLGCEAFIPVQCGGGGGGGSGGGDGGGGPVLDP